MNATFFDERNVHAQCERCNGGLEGNLDVYRARMIEKYGFSFVEGLEARGRKTTLLSLKYLDVIIDKYRGAAGGV